MVTSVTGSAWPSEPGVERAEPRPVLAHPQDLPVGPGLPAPAAGHRVAPSSDVDAHRAHPGSLLPRTTQGCPLVPADVC